ncbi:Uncharacterised protein [Achromobacter sp. 2789STDY5608633]|nr:Uncharacterised protein [Achromobacter sp. 2789STDY5608633]
MLATAPPSQLPPTPRRPYEIGELSATEQVVQLMSILDGDSVEEFASYCAGCFRQLHHDASGDHPMLAIYAGAMCAAVAQAPTLPDGKAKLDWLRQEILAADKPGATSRAFLIAVGNAIRISALNRASFTIGRSFPLSQTIAVLLGQRQMSLALQASAQAHPGDYAGPLPPSARALMLDFPEKLIQLRFREEILSDHPDLTTALSDYRRRHPSHAM